MKLVQVVSQLNTKLFLNELQKQAELKCRIEIEDAENEKKIREIWFMLRPCQHDDGYIDGRSQNKVHTDELTQVHSAQSSLAVTHPINRRRRCLTSVNVSLS